jgi:hypothetical protein
MHINNPNIKNAFQIERLYFVGTQSRIAAKAADHFVSS